MLDIVLELSGRVPSSKSSEESINKKLRTQPIEQSIENFLKYEKKRLETGIIQESTYRRKRLTLKTHLTQYLKSQGITKTRQITDTTFNDYLFFRSGKTRLTWNNELITIKDFLSNWLVVHRLIQPEIVSNRKLLPTVKITQEDLLSNPGINSKDWKIINQEIRRWVKEGSNDINPRVHLWRMCFWTFTLVSKNSGCRPQELMDLRWKDLEIRDVGRISETKYREEVEELESDGIDVIGDLDKTSNEWSSSPEELGRVERLICYITVTSSKTKQTREVPTNLGSVIIRWKQYIDKYLVDHNINEEITSNDYVFGNIRNECKPYPYTMYSKIWCDIRRSVKDRLEGHKFSNHPYTIYSMRSTFIENHLINRLDLFLLSRISGHDPKVLLKHYERIDIRLRSEEITNLPFGKRSKEDIKIEII